MEERRDVNIHVVYEEGQLEKKMIELLENKVKVTHQENIGRANLIKTIRTFIQENE